MRILNVAADPSVQSTLAAMLHSTPSIEVHSANSLRSPLTRLELAGLENRSSPFDLVLIDCEAEAKDAIELCRRIKATPALADLSVIMMGNLIPDGLQAVFDAGASDYLPKPVSQILLQARVQSALYLKRELDRRRAGEQDLARLQHQLDSAQQSLQRLSTRDDLTGLANRRSLDDALVLEWRRALRTQSRMSLIMIDLDCFDAYNQLYGQTRGDATLKEVATTLAVGIRRPHDLCARYDAETFIALLPETELMGAIIVAESMRGRVEALGIVHARSSVC